MKRIPTVSESSQKEDASPALPKTPSALASSSPAKAGRPTSRGRAAGSRSGSAGSSGSGGRDSVMFSQPEEVEGLAKSQTLREPGSKSASASPKPVPSGQTPPNPTRGRPSPLHFDADTSPAPSPLPTSHGFRSSLAQIPESPTPAPVLKLTSSSAAGSPTHSQAGPSPILAGLEGERKKARAKAKGRGSAGSDDAGAANLYRTASQASQMSQPSMHSSQLSQGTNARGSTDREAATPPAPDTFHANAPRLSLSQRQEGSLQSPPSPTGRKTSPSPLGTGPRPIIRLGSRGGEGRRPAAKSVSVSPKTAEGVAKRDVRPSTVGPAAKRGSVPADKVALPYAKLWKQQVTIKKMSKQMERKEVEIARLAQHVEEVEGEHPSVLPQGSGSSYDSRRSSVLSTSGGPEPLPVFPAPSRGGGGLAVPAAAASRNRRASIAVMSTQLPTKPGPLMAAMAGGGGAGPGSIGWSGTSSGQRRPSGIREKQKEQMVEELVQSLDDAQLKIEDLQQEILTYRKDRSDKFKLEKQLFDRDRDIALVEAKLKTSEEETKRLRRNYENVEKELLELQTQITKLQDKVQESEAKAQESASKEHEELRQQQWFRGQRLLLEAKEREMGAKIDNLKSDFVIQKSFLMSEVDRWKGQCEALKATLKSVQEQLKEKEELVGNLQKTRGGSGRSSNIEAGSLASELAIAQLEEERAARRRASIDTAAATSYRKDAGPRRQSAFGRIPSTPKLIEMPHEDLEESEEEEAPRLSLTPPPPSTAAGRGKSVPAKAKARAAAAKGKTPSISVSPAPGGRGAKSSMTGRKGDMPVVVIPEDLSNKKAVLDLRNQLRQLQAFATNADRYNGELEVKAEELSSRLLQLEASASETAKTIAAKDAQIEKLENDVNEIRDKYFDCVKKTEEDRRDLENQRVKALAFVNQMRTQSQNLLGEFKRLQIRLMTLETHSAEQAVANALLTEKLKQQRGGIETTEMGVGPGDTPLAQSVASPSAILSALASQHNFSAIAAIDEDEEEEDLELRSSMEIGGEIVEVPEVVEGGEDEAPEDGTTGGTKRIRMRHMVTFDANSKEGKFLRRLNTATANIRQFTQHLDEMSPVAAAANADAERRSSLALSASPRDYAMLDHHPLVMALRQRVAELESRITELSEEGGAPPAALQHGASMTLSSVMESSPTVRKTIEDLRQRNERLHQLYMEKEQQLARFRSEFKQAVGKMAEFRHCFEERLNQLNDQVQYHIQHAAQSDTQQPIPTAAVGQALQYGEIFLAGIAQRIEQIGGEPATRQRQPRPSSPSPCINICTSSPPRAPRQEPPARPRSLRIPKLVISPVSAPISPRASGPKAASHVDQRRDTRERGGLGEAPLYVPYCRSAPPSPRGPLIRQRQLWIHRALHHFRHRLVRQFVEDEIKDSTSSAFSPPNVVNLCPQMGPPSFGLAAALHHPTPPPNALHLTQPFNSDQAPLVNDGAPLPPRRTVDRSAPMTARYPNGSPHHTWRSIPIPPNLMQSVRNAVSPMQPGPMSARYHHPPPGHHPPKSALPYFSGHHPSPLSPPPGPMVPPLYFPSTSVPPSSRARRIPPLQLGKVSAPPNSHRVSMPNIHHTAAKTPPPPAPPPSFRHTPSLKQMMGVRGKSAHPKACCGFFPPHPSSPSGSSIMQDDGRDARIRRNGSRKSLASRAGPSAGPVMMQQQPHHIPMAAPMTKYGAERGRGR
ncbi:unnamed protein product [Vitrella brassicaformis CCMP3155]|uniref:Uncharacterized protein n=4 Tax=Vitrella brassicaformis TaxID=1169539 RepID=A0A0G4EN45_VITBC|nr:unnamed protein product [Vitrella brassicaformis CCMP3155]|eukprot:CEL98536.1 unnamed protein product [Vitrella brassicaformis CCMP3155]